LKIFSFFSSSFFFFSPLGLRSSFGSWVFGLEDQLISFSFGCVKIDQNEFVCALFSFFFSAVLCSGCQIFNGVDNEGDNEGVGWVVVGCCGRKRSREIFFVCMKMFQSQRDKIAETFPELIPSCPILHLPSTGSHHRLPLSTACIVLILLEACAQREESEPRYIS